MTDPTPAENVRRWLLEKHVGTLCTTMARRGMEGFPYGSVVPFALTASGMPMILIASIATHTANLVTEPRASLFLRESGVDGDPQSGWRITVMGHWEPVAVDNPDLEELQARYVERVPGAADYLATHNFQYWRMSSVDAVRYIGGFGKIHWVDGDLVQRQPHGEGLDLAGPPAIQHMNEDHAHNVLEMVKGRYGLEVEQAEMVGLQRDGFMVRTTGPSHLLWFPFGREITSSTLRTDVISVLKDCRARQVRA